MYKFREDYLKNILCLCFYVYFFGKTNQIQFLVIFLIQVRLVINSANRCLFGNAVISAISVDDEQRI